MKRCRSRLVSCRFATSTPEQDPTQRSGTKLKSASTLESVIDVFFLLFYFERSFLLCESKHCSVFISWRRKWCFRSASQVLLCTYLRVNWLQLMSFGVFWGVVLDVSSSGISHTKEVWESQRKSYNADFCELDPSMVRFSIYVFTWNDCYYFFTLVF